MKMLKDSSATHYQKKTKKGFKKKFVKGIKAFPKKKLKFPWKWKRKKHEYTRKWYKNRLENESKILVKYGKNTIKG